MIREINLKKRTITYNLQYKKVKNINLRIKQDGTVHVSANPRVSLRFIDEFIISRADFILDALDKYSVSRTKLKKQYFSENEIYEIIPQLCKKVYPYFESLGVRYPVIKFRKMVSQWGNCRSSEGILTFNTNLMYAPLTCIEYVVAHEFTHFLQPNHSGKFYDELSKIMPDWKERREMLKEINIR